MALHIDQNTKFGQVSDLFEMGESVLSKFSG